MSEEMTASEALFGFMGWLTTRKEKVTFSSTDNAALAADLVAEFCKVNDLAEPRKHWEKFLTMPLEEKWLLVEDEAPGCPKCDRFPFKYMVTGDGETLYQCKCGHEW